MMTTETQPNGIMLNKTFLDKLYSLKNTVEESLVEARAVTAFPDNGFSDKVHDARVKELKSHHQNVEAIIEAYINQERNNDN